MRQKLIKEANKSGRNWRDEIRNSVPPEALIELAREHEEQEKGVENTERLLNELENALRSSINETPLREYSDFTGRSLLHKIDYSRFSDKKAADIGGEAIARGMRPLRPSTPGESILSSRNPYPDFSNHTQGINGFFKRLSNLIFPKKQTLTQTSIAYPISESALLNTEQWKDFVQRADEHLKFYEYDLERHLEKEDRVLFPSIEKLGGEWKKVSLELYDQHAQQRDFIKSCRQYWNRATSVFENFSDPLTIEKECLVFFRVLDTYLQHLVGHFDYEDNEVFEPALATLNENLLDSIKEAWDLYQKEIKEPDAVEVPGSTNFSKEN